MQVLVPLHRPTAPGSGIVARIGPSGVIDVPTVKVGTAGDRRTLEVTVAAVDSGGRQGDLALPRTSTFIEHCLPLPTAVGSTRPSAPKVGGAGLTSIWPCPLATTQFSTGARRSSRQRTGGIPRQINRELVEPRGQLRDALLGRRTV